jgi:hypothetical protein
VVRVRINYHATIEALLASSRISETGALDRAQVEAAISEIVVEWARRWRDFR